MPVGDSGQGDRAVRDEVRGERQVLRPENRPGIDDGAQRPVASGDATPSALALSASPSCWGLRGAYLLSGSLSSGIVELRRSRTQVASFPKRPADFQLLRAMGTVELEPPGVALI